MTSNHLRNNLDLLKVLHKVPLNTKKHIVAHGDRSLIIAICELALNLLNGTFCCTPNIRKKLQKYKKNLIKLANRKKLSKNFIVEKRIINQQCGQGKSLLTFLIPPALDYIYQHQLDTTTENEYST